MSITENTSEMNREKALEDLLKPIIWSWSSPIGRRKYIVTARRDEVKLVLPFLTDDEKLKAVEWLKKERHRDLWD